MKHYTKIIIIGACLFSHAAFAEVDENGCRNTKKRGYICKPQSAATQERKKKQAKRKQARQFEEDKPAHTMY